MTFMFLLVSLVALTVSAGATETEMMTKNPLTLLAPIRVTEPKKVIGRGLFDPVSQNSLSLACIGDHLPSGAIERNCNVLRFLLRTPGGTEYLVGPSFFLHEGDPTKLQMEEYLATYNIKKDLSQKKKFIATRKFYGPLFRMSKRNKPKHSQKAGSFISNGVVVAQAGGAISGFAFLGSAAAGLSGYFLAPVIFDLVTLPVTAVLDGKNASKIWGFSSKDLRTLQDRSIPAWSLAPKVVRKAKRFRSLLLSILYVSVSKNADNTESRELRFTKEGAKSGRGYTDTFDPEVDPAIAKAMQEDPSVALTHALEESELTQRRSP